MPINVSILGTECSVPRNVAILGTERSVPRNVAIFGTKNVVVRIVNLNKKCMHNVHAISYI